MADAAMRRLELVDRHIRVHVIAPGLADDASSVTGSVFPIDAGRTAV